MLMVLNVHPAFVNHLQHAGAPAVNSRCELCVTTLSLEEQQEPEQGRFNTSVA